MKKKGVERAMKPHKRGGRAAKKRRQESAWGRCKVLREEGNHNFVAGSCKCCGCPQEE